MIDYDETCELCKYCERDADQYPCDNCKHNYSSEFELKGTPVDYWKNICDMQKKQTEKGINKYGQTLEENTSMTIGERLEYLQEELIDALMYIEHIKERIIE